jgi:8-oxo-dGTP diphosphatase
VTIVVECAIEPPVRPPQNPLEITEARLFPASEIPATLAMGMQDMLAATLRGEVVVE